MMADATKGEWTFVERINGYWGSSSDDGIPIPRTSYWLYSPYPDFQCVATFTFKHNVELVCNSLNDPKRKAAPDMYEALKAQHHAIDILFALLIEKDNTFYPSKSGKPWEALLKGNQALTKAEGK